jgi:hypothetical protein
MNLMRLRSGLEAADVFEHYYGRATLSLKFVVTVLAAREVSWMLGSVGESVLRQLHFPGMKLRNPHGKREEVVYGRCLYYTRGTWSLIGGIRECL